MKKFIILLALLLFPVVSAAKLEKYSKTGHDQFSELVFTDEEDQDQELLVNMSKKFIDDNLKDIKSTFCATKTKYLYKYKDVNYVSTVVFSRSNKTREKIIFDYSLQTVHYKESSFSVKGSLSYKSVNKTSKVDNQFTADAQVEYSVTESTRKTESSSMKVTIEPNKKITLRVAGEGKISMGFSKTFVFWICFKKGAWETVDVVTSYFELIEENA